MDKKILVLGSEPHSRLVTAYNWHEIPLYLNVADYDIVIFNLVSLIEKSHIAKIDFKLIPKPDQLGRFLFSDNSELVIIGYPGIQVQLDANSFMPVDWWLPIELRVIKETGKQITKINPSFRYYFDQVEEWRFPIESYYNLREHLLQYYLPTINPFANILNANITSIAETRYDKFIAFEIKLILAKLINNNYNLDSRENIEIINESGSIIWLPPTTKISHYDAVNLILTKRYGLVLEQEVPDWVKAYKLPTQIPIENRLSNYTAQIQKLQDDLDIAKRGNHSHPPHFKGKYRKRY